MSLKPLEDELPPSAPEVLPYAITDSEQARADLHVQTICLLILAFVAAGVALWLLRPVLVPFVLALFFAACLKPLIEFQRRYFRFPQPVAVFGALLVAVGLIVLIGFPLINSVEEIQGPFYENVKKFFHQGSQGLQRFGLSAPFAVPEMKDWPFSGISSVLGAGLGAASATVLVIIFTLFLLLGRRVGRGNGMLYEIDLRVQLYIRQMVVLSAVAGVLVGLVLGILGIGPKFAVVFGFFAFLLNFIPTVGSIIATLLPLPVILLSAQMGLPSKILAMAIPAALQIYLGNAVQPRVLGNALDLHPIVVLISLIFWSMIWGLPGAFLATPMTAVLRIVLEKIPATRPLAMLLAGRLDLVF